IHDAAHARLVEALLRLVDPSWQINLEAPIAGRPSASTDVRLDRGDDTVLIEVESRVSRLEEIVREGHIKQAATRESAPGRRVNVVLVLPLTRHHRALAGQHRATIAAAFPVSSDAIRHALERDDGPWPGDGILWVTAAGPAPTATTSSPTRRPPPGRGRR